MIDRNTFDDITRYPILDYINEHYDALNKNEKALLARTLNRIKKIHSGLNLMLNLKIDNDFVKLTAILHKDRLNIEINNCKLPNNIKTTISNYLNTKFKPFTSGKLK